MLLKSLRDSLSSLSNTIKTLSDEQFSQKVPALSGATVGEHTRHIIEMLQCLISSYHGQNVNYDKRPRNTLIQTSTDAAIEAIRNLSAKADLPDRTLILHQETNGEQFTIQTNYNREMLYNLEHCVHHQAMIKIALTELGVEVVDSEFGVARSTIEYRKQCAQ